MSFQNIVDHDYEFPMTFHEWWSRLLSSSPHFKIQNYCSMRVFSLPRLKSSVYPTILLTAGRRNKRCLFFISIKWMQRPWIESELSLLDSIFCADNSYATYTSIIYHSKINNKIDFPLLHLLNLKTSNNMYSVHSFTLRDGNSKIKIIIDKRTYL